MRKVQVYLFNDLMQIEAFRDFESAFKIYFIETFKKRKGTRFNQPEAINQLTKLE